MFFNVSINCTQPDIAKGMTQWENVNIAKVNVGVIVIRLPTQVVIAKWNHQQFDGKWEN